MKKTAFYSDLFFAFVVGGLLSLCLFRYLKFPLSLALVFSSLTGLLLSTLTFLLLTEKRKRLNEKELRKQKSDALNLYLAELSDDELFSLFSSVLSPLKQNAPFWETDDTVFYPLFPLAEQNADVLLPLYRLHTEKKKILLCTKLSPKAEEIASSLHIELWKGEKLFNLLQTSSALPQLDLPNKQRKKFFRLAFDKKKAKPFFWSGTVLLLSSLISPFPFYYVVWGGTLLLFSVFLRFFSKQEDS